MCVFSPMAALRQPQRKHRSLSTDLDDPSLSSSCIIAARILGNHYLRQAGAGNSRPPTWAAAKERGQRPWATLRNLRATSRKGSHSELPRNPSGGPSMIVSIGRLCLALCVTAAALLGGRAFAGEASPSFQVDP